MFKIIRWFAVLVLTLLVACSQQGWGNAMQARSDFEQSADVQGVTLAVIETRNGSVEVSCDGSGTQAGITGTKFAQALTLEAARERVDKIEIVVEREAGKPEVLRVKALIPPFSGGSAGANFRVTLPQAVAVNIHTSNGSATVTGAGGDVDIETSNGSIRAEAVGGSLSARTSNAAINARDVAGDVEAVSSNGSVDLENAGRQRLRAKTTNARIRAIEPRGQVSLTSSNGSVELKAASLPPEPQVRIETTNASVRIEAPRGVRAALRLKTTNASVQTDFSGAEVTHQQSGNHDLAATLNGGGGRIDAQTSNGSIHFKLIEGKLTRG